MVFINASDVKDGYSSIKMRKVYAFQWQKNGKVVKSGFATGKQLVNSVQWKHADSRNFKDLEMREIFA